MNKTKITLTLLVSMVMGTALPLNQLAIKQLRSSAKKKGSHLIQCLKGKEPCSKTDFAILATALLVARSSFHAILSIGKHTYEPSAHQSVDSIPDKVSRKNFIGTTARKVDKLLNWGPGRLPKRMVRKARIWWATTTNNGSGEQTR